MLVNFVPSEIAAMRPRELNPDGSLLTASQWAERFRVVSHGPEPGPWSNLTTPYLVEPMDMCSDPYCQKLILCFAPQTGKTQIAFNFLCWAADQQPDPVMYVMPDEKTARRMSKRRILPMLKSTPRIRSLLSSSQHDQTTLSVNLKNGMDIMLVWSTSAAELASESVRYMIFDETDKYPEFSGKEGDPISLGEVRTTTYGDDRKILYLSTPTNETGIIARAMELEADQVRKYHAMCPECGSVQEMIFDQIRWPGSIRDPRLMLRHKPARYECIDCKCWWTDHMRDQAVQAGHWQPDRDIERPVSIGYVLPSWYSPFVSLSSPAAAFLAGRKDPTKLWTFVTQHKAEPWKETLRERKEDEILSLRNTLPAGICPAETVAVTAAFDMQLHGFWHLIRAWDQNLNSHLINYGWIESWEQIAALLDSKIQVAGSDRTMTIWRAGLDTGGGANKDDQDGEWSRTQEAYDFLRANMWRRTRLGGGIFGIKGQSRKMGKIVAPRHQDYTAQGKKIKGGMTLYFLDTDALKKDFFDCLTATGQEGVTNRQISLHSGADMDYAKQILAEEQRRDRRGKIYWHQIRRDNHLLDCEMISQALMHESWHPSFGMVKGILAGGIKNQDDKPKPRPKPQPQQKVSLW